MRGCCLSTGLFLTCLLGYCAPAGADEVGGNRSQSPQYSDSSRLANGEAIQGLLYFPKDIRDAALELSRYPDLVIKLRYNDPSEVGKLLAGYPTSAQAAARVVVGRGDALATMQRSLLAMSSLGKAYAANPDAVRAMVDALSEKSHEESKVSSDAWAKRLEKNPTAAQQLLVATSELAKSSAPANAANNALPTPEQTQYVLLHSDRYPELAGEIVDQWESEKNPEPFRQAVDLWYAQRRDSLPENFGSDAAFRAKVLKEQALFESRYAEAVRTAKTTPPTRMEFLELHEKEFESLSEVQYMKSYAVAAAKPVQVGGGPWTGGGGGSGGSRSSSSSSRSGGSSSRSGGSMSSRSGGGGSMIMSGSSRRRGRNSSDSNSNSSSRRGSGRNSNNSSSGRFGSGGNSGGFGGGSGGFGGGSGGFGGGSGGFGGGSGGFGGGSNFGGGSSSSSGSRSQRQR